MKLAYPTSEKARFIQGFGNWNPALYPGGRHMGIDIAAVVGTPIYAVCPGVVEFVNVFGAHGYGRHVVIEHGVEFKSLYAHLHKVLVVAGQTVEAGQVIGEMGGDPNDSDKIDGASTGPHLHFEILINHQPDMDFVKTPHGYAVDGFAYLLKHYAPHPIFTGRVVEKTGIRVRPLPNNANPKDFFDSFSFGKVLDIAEVKDVDSKGYVWARVNALRTEWVCIEYQNKKYVTLTPLAPTPLPPSTGTSPQIEEHNLGGENEIRLDEVNRMIAYLQARAKELQ